MEDFLDKLPDELKLVILQSGMRMFPKFEASVRCVARAFRVLPSMGFPFYKAGSGERFAIETLRGLENTHLHVPEDLEWKGKTLGEIREDIERTLKDCKPGVDTDWHEYEKYREGTSLYFEPTLDRWVFHVVFVYDEVMTPAGQAPLPAQYACWFLYMGGSTITESGRAFLTWLEKNRPIRLQRVDYYA